jgi:opacity protein-like surface antigen
MKTLIAAAGLAALVSLAPAMAQAQDTGISSGVYGTLGYAQAGVDEFDFGGVQGRLGYRFNNWFGVEGEVAFGTNEERISVPTTQGPVNVDFKLKNSKAIYGVGFIPLASSTDIIARIGYGHSEIEGEALGVSASEGGSSWNFGIGAQHHFDGLNGVRVDYTRHEFNDEGGAADVWSVAYTRRF